MKIRYLLMCLLCMILSSCNTGNNSIEENVTKLEDEIFIDENISFSKLSEMFELANKEKDEQLRNIKIAEVEELLLNSCLYFPYMNDNVSINISKVLPSSYLHYYSDVYSLDYLKVFNRLLTKEEIEEINNKDNLDMFYNENNLYTKDTASFYHHESFDCFNIYGKMSYDNRLILSQCYSSLFKVDNKGNLTLDLAKSYEVSEDGKTYTFNLKENIYYYDYLRNEIDKIKAEDFVLSLKYYLSNKVGSSKIDNAEQYINNFVSFDKVGIKAIDDKTLSITLKDDNFHLFYEISNYLYPMHKSTYDLLDDGIPLTYKNNLYSGSYVISIKDELVTILVKNEKYVNANNVNLKEIKFTYEALPSKEIINKVIDGTYDSLSCKYNDSMYNYLKEYESIKDYVFYNKGKNKINYGCFNLSNEKLRNSSLRKAIVYSFNKNEFIEKDFPKEISDLVVTNTFNGNNNLNYIDNKTYNNDNFVNMTYLQVIQHFANKRNNPVDYSNTYNEELATLYFNEYFKNNETDDKLSLKVVCIENQKEQLLTFTNNVSKLSNNKIVFEYEVVKNNYDYFVITNQGKYDILFYNYWTPDYYDASAFIETFFLNGEKNNLLGL